MRTARPNDGGDCVGDPPVEISPVLGYLLAGVGLGPYGLGALDGRAPWLDALAINVDAIDKLAAFGVVALLFTMGLELSFERLRRMRRLVFGLGLLQVAVTTIVLTAIAWRLGLKPVSAAIHRRRAQHAEKLGVVLSYHLCRAPLAAALLGA